VTARRDDEAGGSWWTAPALQQNRARFVRECDRRQAEMRARDARDGLVLGPMIPARRKIARTKRED
jgi:hypothetical protein